MLDHVIETLQSSPGIHRVEAQLLAHPTAELGAPFLATGFERFRRLFLALNLRGQDAPSLPSTPRFTDIHIRRWMEQDYQPSAGVITAAYRSHIDSEINDQYRTNAGSLRFLNNIVRFPGCGVFDVDSSFAAVHRPSQSLVGVILCSRVKDDVGHVTQVCLLPEYRGRGLGEGLILATYNSLRQRNFEMLSLTVTEANHRAVDLYKKLGFTERRVFDAFVWEG